METAGTKSALTFDNMVLLTFVGSEFEGDLKRKIIFMSEPNFSDYSDEALIEKYAKILNTHQRQAISKCLTCQDYALIWGLPGSGKTTTIAVLTQILVLKGYSVLITANSNNAVDNILLKLLERNVPFVRIGPQNRVHNLIRPSSLFELVEGKSSVQVAEILNDKKIFATTCSSLSNKIFIKHSTYDYCIIDEASQALLPSFLAALRMSKKFVLVGDHLQLPPVLPPGTTSEDKVSLFECLLKSYPRCVTALKVQYRMPKLLGDMCSEFFYDGIMISNDKEESDSAATCISKANEMGVSDWLKFALHHEKAILLISSDGNSRDCETGLKNIDTTEAVGIVRLYTTLVQLEIPVKEISILTPFKDQMDLISKLCSNEQVYVDVNTIDRFQGCERSYIIISTCTTERNDKASTLTSCRVNVALTRAKRKIFLFGNMKNLATCCVEMSRVIKKLKEIDCVVYM